MKIKNLFFALFIISIFICSCGGDDSGCTDPNACNYDPNATEDNGDCQSGSTWYEDQDGDGLGNPNSFITSCTEPEGYVSDNSDDFDLFITNEQRAVIGYVGATWCPPCGEWGGPLFDYIDENFDNSKAVVISFHVGDYISPAHSEAADYGLDIMDVTGTVSIPHIYVGGASYYKSRGMFSSHDDNQSYLLTDINSITDLDAKIGVNGSAKLENDQIEVHVDLKFFSSVNNEYYISTYLVEDKIVADQSVGTTQNSTLEKDVVHNHIVRANMDGAASFKGKSIGNSFSENELVSEDFIITIPTLLPSVQQVNSENIKVAIVVWTGGSFRMENGIILDIK